MCRVRTGPGEHCGSTALRHLSEHHGWGLDEPECFGIGAGIGFSYVEGGPADRMIKGRMAHLEPAFFDNLGIAVTHASGQDRQAAWDALVEWVEDGPVFVIVDLEYLPYFGTDTYFGPHTILAVDVDETSVTVSGSEFDALQTVDRDAFDRAWTSEKGFGHLERRWRRLPAAFRRLSGHAGEGRRRRRRAGRADLRRRGRLDDGGDVAPAASEEDDPAERAGRFETAAQQHVAIAEEERLFEALADVV